MKKVKITELNIRPIKANEIMLLTDFLYEAVFKKPGEVFPRTIIQKPEIWQYVDEFGIYPHDYAFVAEADGIVVGAIWARKIKGYGYVDDATPELAMAVYPEYQKLGIGRKLLAEMISFLKDKGYTQVSLSVQKANYASKMYLELGFKVFSENEEDYIMINTLQSNWDFAIY